MFTWSFGWTPSPARLAITSFAFMFDDVPEPVWKTSIGNWSSSSPPATRSAAAAIRSALSASRSPSSAFTRAAAALMRPSQRATEDGIGSPETGKLATALSVSAPQRASREMLRTSASLASARPYAATLAQTAYTVTLQLPAKAAVSCASAVQVVRSPDGELRVIASEFDVVFTAAPPPSTFFPLGQETLRLLTVFEFVAESPVTSSSALTPAGPVGPAFPAGPCGPTAPIELGSFPYPSRGRSM